jgi:hypothetical protein
MMGHALTVFFGGSPFQRDVWNRSSLKYWKGLFGVLLQTFQ